MKCFFATVNSRPATDRQLITTLEMISGNMRRHSEARTMFSSLTKFLHATFQPFNKPLK